MDAIVQAAIKAFDSVVHPIIDMINAVVGSWVEGLRGMFDSFFIAHSPIQTLNDYLTIAQGLWRYMLMPLVLVATLITVAETVEVVMEAMSLGIAGVLSRLVQLAAPIFLFGVAASAIGAVALSFDGGLDKVLLDQLGSTSKDVTTFLGTQRALFTLNGLLVTETAWMSGAALSILSIFFALFPKDSVWWHNLLADAFSLMLAAAGLFKYLTGPSDRLAKVITPFVSTILGIVVYSAFVSWGLRFESDLASGSVQPPAGG